MTEKEKASTSDEERHALALATTQGDPVEEQSEDTKRKIYFALAAVSVVVLLFGAMRLGNLSGMGSGQGVQCTAQYTTCVLGCNKQSVTISQKIQSGATEAEKNKWEKRLLQLQTRCIPMCYQVHCVGKTPKEAAAALKLNAKTQAN